MTEILVGYRRRSAIGRGRRRFKQRFAYESRVRGRWRRLAYLHKDDKPHKRVGAVKYFRNADCNVPPSDVVKTGDVAIFASADVGRTTQARVPVVQMLA